MLYFASNAFQNKLVFSHNYVTPPPPVRLSTEILSFFLEILIPTRGRDGQDPLNPPHQSSSELTGWGYKNQLTLKFILGDLKHLDHFFPLRVLGGLGLDS